MAAEAVGIHRRGVLVSAIARFVGVDHHIVDQAVALLSAAVNEPWGPQRVLLLVG